MLGAVLAAASQLHYLRRSFTTNGTEKRREEKGDLMVYGGVPVPELRLRTLVGKQSGPSAAPGCSPPTHKADAALSWEFVSDTDQTHFI